MCLLFRFHKNKINNNFAFVAFLENELVNYRVFTNLYFYFSEILQSVFIKFCEIFYQQPPPKSLSTINLHDKYMTFFF